MERFKLAFWFNGTFAAVVLCFFAATGIVHWQAGAIDRATLELVEGAIDAGRADEVAARMKQLRAESTRVAFGLDAACALIAFSGAMLLGRSAEARAAAGERRRRLQEERASELEHFAGRVAHDILSPLGTVGYALEIAAGPGEGPERGWALGRGQAALDRVKRLVVGLLDFARAGGKPDAGARADVAGTIADLASELGPPAAEAGVELSVKQGGAHFVACNPGVLTSLAANLARNAIKYIGDGPVRRVEIRVLKQDRVVRIEVEDTGPGLAPDLEKRIFEPYVRAPDSRQPGLGLGLATVKRLAEAHGGRVGVRSVAGQGSTFWFELPAIETRAVDVNYDAALDGRAPRRVRV